MSPRMTKFINDRVNGCIWEFHLFGVSKYYFPQMLEFQEVNMEFLAPALLKSGICPLSCVVTKMIMVITPNVNDILMRGVHGRVVSD